MSAIGFPVVGILKALYEHEEVQGEGDAADGAHRAVEAVEGGAVGGGEGAGATEDAVVEDDKGGVVDQHGEQGDPF